MSTRENEQLPDERPYDEGRDGALAAGPRDDFVSSDAQTSGLRDGDPTLDPDDSADRADLADRGGLPDREGRSDRGSDAGRDVLTEPDALGNQEFATDGSTPTDHDAIGDRDALGDQRAGDAGVIGGRSVSTDDDAPADPDALAGGGTTDAGTRTHDEVAAGPSASDALSPDDVGSGTTEAGTGAATSVTATGTGVEEERLVRPDLAMDLKTRWDVIQRSFVDDPRNAVSDADSLVEEVLQRLSDGFDEQQRNLESQWHDGAPSTEDLRSALQRYRAYFHRLLEV